MNNKIRTEHVSFAIAALVVIVLVRLLSIGMVDLIDPTEGRYAFVAQEMVLSGDWITPKLLLPTGLEPYLGKPPLHFWLTSICMTVFGMDAWVTRLPSFFGWLLIAACTYVFGVRFFSKKIALSAAAILTTSGLLFFLSASCTVDVTFSAWICGALTAFAFAAEKREENRGAGYLFFLFCALAFLTKGPAGLILIGAPIFFWLFSSEARNSFPRLPWLGGVLLFILITAPWFIASELRHPGFLHYFFVQENFLRFVTKDYGDRFGTGHVYPRGSAIWMALVGFLPWSAVYLGVLFYSKGARKLISAPTLWFRFALCWAFSATLFFCFARQLHAAYMIPAFPGMALITAITLEQVALPRIGAVFSALITLALTVTAGLFPVSFFLHGDFSHCVAAAIFIAPCLYLLKNATFSGDHFTSTIRFALALTAVCGAFTPLYARHAGLIKSSREILSTVAPRLAPDERQVGIFSVNAYSFYYYARDWESQLGAPIDPVWMSFDAVAANPPFNLILNKHDLKQVSEETKSRYQEVIDFGKWHWWKRK